MYDKENKVVKNYQTLNYAVFCRLQESSTDRLYYQDKSILTPALNHIWT